MNKSELKPLEHILITRSRQVYWYVGEALNTQKECKSLYTYVDCNLDTWDDNLISIRDGSVYISEKEPRLHDIIYVYEVTDMDSLFKLFRTIDYIKYPDYFNKRYFGKDWCKLLYERIDGGLEDVS